MIFIIDSQGNTKNVLYEPIYQGSNNANQIVLFAPFPKTNAITVSYTLANGIQTHPFVMTLCNDVPDIKTEKGTQYNVWSIDIDHPITEYAGHVDVQFIVHMGNGKMLSTYKSGFEVGTGIISELPELPEEDIYKKILNKVSSIEGYSKDASDKAISYIRYIAPDEYLINKETSDIILSSYANHSYEGDFTVEGMTKYLDKDNLTNPNTTANADSLFFTNTVNAKLNGFIVDLLKPVDVGIVQAYLFKIEKDVEIECKYSTNGIDYVLAETKPISKGDFVQIVQFKVNAQASYLMLREVTKDSNASRDFAYKGVEIFAPNVDGEFEIARNNGNISTIDTYDAQILIGIVESLKNDTEQAKTEAFDKVEEITGAENEKNGFVRLDSDAKIPTSLIPSLVVVNRQTYYVYDDTEDDINNYLISLIRNGEAQPNDYVDIVKMVNVPSINDPNVFIEREVIQRSYVYIGSALVDRLSDAQILNGWKIIGTDYASFAAHSATSDKAYTTDRIQDVLFRIGNIDKYNASDKKGVYIVSEYTTEELTNG